MARDFDAVDDVLSSGLDYTFPTLCSIFARIMPDTSGGGAFGRILQFVDGSANTIINFIIRDDQGGSPANRVSMQRGWDGGNGEWYGGTTFALDVWHDVCLTYDGGSTSNNPGFFQNGASISTTLLTSPSGNLRTAVGDSYIGNRAAGDRGWDGALAELGVWNRILTLHEYLLVRIGGPMAVPHGLLRYWPIHGIQSPEPDWMGAQPMTVTTGTTRVDHPHSHSATWLSPHPRRVLRPQAAAGGDSLTPPVGAAALAGQAGRMDLGVLVPQARRIGT